MTTLELFKKHRKGEVSRERFLYEVRRDNNLPWITNTTSYNDAVKILKNKGIVRESVENVATDPAVDRVNPYFLKSGVNKILDGEKELTNDSYANALNKAGKQLAANPHAFDNEMFANADTVKKADAKLQMTPVKKNNFVDKDNGMKKVKGQEAPKAMSAPTKENRKGKPKGVKVMPDKGVTGTQKIMKEISEFIKKKLNENSAYSGFHEGKEVETQYGPGVVREIDGSTLTIETKDGKLRAVQMSEVNHYEKKKQEEAEQQEAIDVRALGGHEGGMELANKLIDAIKMYNDLDPDQKQAEIERLKSNIPAELRAKFEELMAALHDEGNYPPQEEDEYLQENEFADEDQNQPDYYINVSLRDASRAIEIYRDINIIPRESVRLDGTDSYVIDDLEIAQELLSAFQEQDIEIIDTDVPAIDSEYDTDYEDELEEKVSDDEIRAARTTGEVINVPASATSDIAKLQGQKVNYSTYKG